LSAVLFRIGIQQFRLTLEAIVGCVLRRSVKLTEREEPQISIPFITSVVVRLLTAICWDCVKKWRAKS